MLCALSLKRTRLVLIAPNGVVPTTIMRHVLLSVASLARRKHGEQVMRWRGVSWCLLAKFEVSRPLGLAAVGRFRRP